MTQHLDQYMDDFGDRLAQARPPKRRRRRLALGAALVVAAGTPLALLLPGGGGAGPVNAIAQARDALAPKDSIVHLQWRTSSSDSNLGTSTSEVWSADDPERQRVVATMNFPNGKQAVDEFSYSGDEAHHYSPARDVLSISRRPDYADSGTGPNILLGTDPAGNLQRLLASGKLTDEGEHDLDGRRVHRFTATEHMMAFVYDVDAETYEPVRMTAQVKDRPERPVITLTVTQFERLKKTPANEQLLAIKTTRETKLSIYGRELAERYAVSGGGIKCEAKGKIRYECRHR